MQVFGRDFLEEMKGRFEIDLAGATTIESAASPELERRVSRLLPTARSVVVFAKEICKEVVDLLKAGQRDRGSPRRRPSPRAHGVPERETQPRGTRTGRILPTQRLPLPAASRRCANRPALSGRPPLVQTRRRARGLGKIGWHSLLITREFGPRVRLACLITEALLEPSPRAVGDFCEGCGVCVTSCPAKAFEAPGDGVAYAMNRFSCRSYRQAGLTCSVCMKVCDEALAGKGTGGGTKD